MVLPGEFDHASPFIQELAYEKSSMADAKYLATRREAIGRRRVRRRCRAAAGEGRRRQGNRRSGRVQSSVPHEERNEHDPSEAGQSRHRRTGRADRSRSRRRSARGTRQGKLLGCVVNFACHATTSPGGASANYIYYLEKAVRGFFGPETVVVFTAGCCGDITQVDNLGDRSAAQAGAIGDVRRRSHRRRGREGAAHRRAGPGRPGRLQDRRRSISVAAFRDRSGSRPVAASSKPGPSRATRRRGPSPKRFCCSMR